jgi:predicted transposase/invertase (TIGR01784 family)
VKTDTIFYSLFQEFPSIFFELVNQSPTEAVDYEFTSREVKQLAFRLDGLFLPTNQDQKKPFYLVEVQFQPDDDFYYRLFAELFLYLKQYQPSHPWQVVIIYPTRSIEREQPIQFAEMLQLPRVKRIYLDELGESSLGVGVVKLVIENEQTAPEKAKRLISQANQEINDTTIKRDLIKLIETIIVYKLPQKSRKEIEAMLGLSELKQTRVYQEALEEGRQEGVIEASRRLALNLLRIGMTLEQIAEVTELSIEQVKALQKEVES